MNCRASSDSLFLLDEKFDFDVSLSPASSKGDEDEDEVFVGPVSHKEGPVSVNVESQLEDGGLWAGWRPLTGDQLEAVCEEAHKLANQLQTGDLSRPHSEEDKDSNMPAAINVEGEGFVQDAQAKLSVLGETATVLSPIKRQTFCVQDSPMKQLPPAVQRRLLRGNSATAASSTHPTSAASSTRAANTPLSTRRSLASTNSFTRQATATRLSTSSPATGAKSQPRTGLRAKAPLGVGVVLPSKPAAPATSCSASKSKVEKTRLQPSSKVGVALKLSPSSRPSSRAESREDLLSDSASVTSDISDSSINSSLLGKRSLAPPTKSAVRNLPGVKAPRLQGRSMTDRKNTSSSSSSVSSFNSSLSLSPAAGKLNSSLNRSLSSSTGPAPSSTTRPLNPSRTRRSTLNATVEPVSSSRRSLSAQAKKLLEVERVKATKSTPLKKVEAIPAKRALDKNTSVLPATSARLQSGVKAKSKPEALVLPTPSGGVRGLPKGDDASKMMKPKRLMSVGSLDSVPQKSSTAPLTPSAGSCRSMQVKARRPTALPTPVRRRMSAIPLATPTSHTRPTRPPGSALTKREGSCSPIHTASQEAGPDIPSIQPFCLEEEEPPAAPPSSPPQLDQSECTDAGAVTQGESEPSKNLIELETAEESNNKAPEVLLLDLPAPQPPEKLLIDLTNTPDLIRTSNKSCTTTQQLIDLTSPLIKWSPEDKRENNAPLINLSF